MGKPKKIRKKNSILFTTKHHSFNGIMGVVLLVLCMMITITSVMFSFHNRGDVTIDFGYYGFLSAVLNIIGLISGILSLQERDIHKYVPIIAIVGNTFMLIAWAAIIILAGL